MRWLLVLLVLRAASAGEPAALPLSEGSGERDGVLPALMALSRGDAAAFATLPAAVFTAASGVADGDDPDLVRRWTSAIPAALARLPGPARDAALAALDQRCRLLLADAGDEDGRTRVAAAFLPAPSAAAALDAAADRAFDHGDFRRYLALGALREDGDPRRRATALALLGAGPAIDPAQALAAPGLPIPTEAAAPPVASGLGVRWLVVPGWLLARDPWGPVRWQYRLEARAEVVAGDGGALVRDGRGLRLIDERGGATPLPPAPAQARLLAVAGGAAWFATGQSVHRIDLGDHLLATIALPADPLAAPLVRGADSLWLTADELVLVRGTAVGARIRHGLAAARGWSLAVEDDRPLISSGDGRSWHVGALEHQLAQAPPGERLALLVRADRAADALALYAAEPALADDPASRRLALRAHLALGPDHVQAVADPALALADQPQERATVLAALGREAALGELCAAHPEVLLPRGGQAWAGDPGSWSQVLAGRAWADRAGLADWLALPAVQRGAIAPGAGRAADGHDQPMRQDDGTWLIGRRRVRCEAGIAATTVDCRDADGALLWRQRWPALDPLAAPGRALSLRDTWIVLVEGAARVRVLDLGNGDLLADLGLGGSDLAPDTVVPLGDGRIADLGPLGLDTVLHLRGRAGTTTVPLPAPGRWILPWGDGVLVALADGRALALPGGTAVDLPDALHRGPPPAVTRSGLEAGGRCWPWRR